MGENVQHRADAWCEVDDCSSVVCKGPHAAHECGRAVVTLRVGDSCPWCGHRTDPTPSAPEVPIIDRTQDSDFECALTFAPLFYDTPEGL